METEKLSSPTAPLGCFLLLLPAGAELFRTGRQPKQRGLGTACSRAAGWGVLLLAGSWASRPTHPYLVGAAGPRKG